ncbi:MAG: hypothetical protein ACYCOU_19440 [Sulfobacillus sp.]
MSYKRRGRTFIIGLAEKLHIHPAVFDRYMCPICWQGHHPSEGSFPPKKRQGFLNRFADHEELVAYLRTLHKTQRTTLKDGEVILIYDYTRFHETSEVKINDLGIVLITSTATRYFDFFAEASHDYHYTYTVMDEFFQIESLLQNVTKIHVWSDGGLRMKENIYLFAQLQQRYQIEIYLFIFPPYHGHSLADGHFGVGKRKLRREYAQGGLAALKDVEKQFKSMHNTSTFILDAISKDVYNVKTLKAGIQHFFTFAFPSPGTVRCWYKYPHQPQDQPLVRK